MKMATKRLILIFSLISTVLLTLILASPQLTSADTIFADYEGGFPADWFQYQGGAVVSPSVDTIADTDSYALPGQVGDNDILRGTFNNTDFGGFGAAFNPSMNWADEDGVSYWFYGTNSGQTFTFEIQDGTPGMGVDRYHGTFVDDFKGWQEIDIPFTDFFYADYQENPPNDGLTLLDVRGWAYPLPPGAGSFAIDDMAVYGDGTVTLRVGFDTTEYAVVEGETATVTVSLNTTSASDVMVDVISTDGSAMAGEDYTAVNETVIIPAGDTSATFTVTTIDDSDDELAETALLTLGNVQGAELGINIATLSIGDNDESSGGGEKVEIVDDFEMGLPTGTDGDGLGVGFVTWNDPNSAISIAATSTDDAGIAAVPNNDGSNRVIELTSDVASWGGFTHAFENDALDTWVSQDWSSYEGIGFWYHGLGNGTLVFVDVIENRNAGATTDDAERWSYEWNDDTAGWQYIEIPFAALNRKDIGNGAPFDGWTGEEVHGWAFGTTATNGTELRYIDDFGTLIRVLGIDDFEDGLPTGTDGNGLGVGFVTWNDSNSSVSIATATTDSAGISAVPNMAGMNQVMELTSNIVSWGGFTHAFENDAVDTWVNQDWSTYEGLCFWYHGTGNGELVFVDVIENRNPGATTDDAERWSFEWADDQAGWRFMQIPFDAMNRKDIGNGAPFDGWSGEEVHGWALGTTATGGEMVRYVDEVSIYGNTGAEAVLEVEFATTALETAERGSAVIVVELNMPSTEDVMVNLSTAESYATPARDFTPIDVTITIPAGSTQAEVEFASIDDDEVEGTEQVMVILTDAVNAELGFARRAMVEIIDNDDPVACEINDIEGDHSYTVSGNTTLDVLELSDGGALSIPGQDSYEDVLNVGYNPGSAFTQHYPEPQDWSQTTGMSFWFYGNNTGNRVTVDILDNNVVTTAEVTPSDWVLLWSDEFDALPGSGFDRTKWSAEIGDGTMNGIPGWGNGELQYYGGENAVIDGENLIVAARQNSDPNKLCYYGMCEYTSSRLVSTDKFTAKYGRVEASVKVPFGQGIWPAFWMLGDDIGEVGWPQSGEIDIMEHIGREPTKAYGTVHGPGYSGGAGVGSGIDLGVNIADDFHQFAIEWEPNEIRWYLDGTQYFSVTPNDVSGEWVFDHPFYLIMNIAVGGNWPGYPDETSTFPQTMTVEYVRVYGAADTAERYSAQFVDNFTGWQQITLPYGIFERSADQPAGAPNDGFGLNEVWGYSFTMDGTGSYLLDQIMCEEGAPTSVNLTETSAFQHVETTGLLISVTALAVALIFWRIRKRTRTVNS